MCNTILIYAYINIYKSEKLCMFPYSIYLLACWATTIKGENKQTNLKERKKQYEAKK